MYLHEQMWEWDFREFMIDFHIPLEQHLHALFFLWKNGGILKVSNHKSIRFHSPTEITTNEPDF